MPYASPSFRLTLFASLLTWGGAACALGLGELRTNSSLGARLVAQVDVNAMAGEIVDSSCFRLRIPAGEHDLPWLRRGALTYRKGPPSVLEIQSDAPIGDPVLQVGVVVGCGYEMQRDFTLLLSPPMGKDDPVTLPLRTVPVPERPAVPRQRPVDPDGWKAREIAPSPRKAPPGVGKRAPAPGGRLVDRLVLSSGAGESGPEPGLRMATELAAGAGEASPALTLQRDLLRLQFRMLLALGEQPVTTVEPVDKLREMEATLQDLQRRVAAASAVPGTAAGTPAVPATAPASAVAEAPSPAAPTATPVATDAGGAPPRAKVSSSVPATTGERTTLTEWTFYGLLASALLGVAGWLGWRQYQQRRGFDEPFSAFVPEPQVDPRKEGEAVDDVAVDLPLDQTATGDLGHVDFPLDPEAVNPEHMTTQRLSGTQNSQFSVSAATVDEHFEANPVMELAEIMLSFGRVKGAAQALQEFIDNNPQEALQPWIRLLDVYRMAGMRDEFERVGQNLNQHFNVEIQRWDPGAPELLLGGAVDIPLDGAPGGATVAPKAMEIEQIDHIRDRLVECWRTPECINYLHQLLRDNRGGKRSGFSLPVVEELLFLIELMETVLILESEVEQETDNE